MVVVDVIGLLGKFVFVLGRALREGEGRRARAGVAALR